MDLSDLNQTKEWETPEEGNDCPECTDGKMVKRYARSFEGGEFLGCSNYPECRFTQNI